MSDFDTAILFLLLSGISIGVWIGAMALLDCKSSLRTIENLIHNRLNGL